MERVDDRVELGRDQTRPKIPLQLDGIAERMWAGCSLKDPERSTCIRRNIRKPVFASDASASIKSDVLVDTWTFRVFCVTWLVKNLRVSCRFLKKSLIFEVSSRRMVGNSFPLHPKRWHYAIRHYRVLVRLFFILTHTITTAPRGKFTHSPDYTMVGAAFTSRNLVINVERTALIYPNSAFAFILLLNWEIAANNRFGRL